MRRAVDVWFCAAKALFKSLLIGSMLVFAACDEDSKGEGGAGEGVPAAELSCSGIFDCAAACSEEDTACVDACVAAGSDAAVEAVSGIVTCYDDSGCGDDEACFGAACEAELVACAATSASHGGEELPAEVPAGNVPAELVGQWRSPEESYLFREDGTVSRDLHINASVCGADALEHGVAVADGETLTIYFLEGEISTCGSDEPYQPYTEVFGYYFRSEGVVLVLTGGNCTANCEQGFDKQ
jgi:hypothetical protein